MAFNPSDPHVRVLDETRVAGRRLANQVNGSLGVSFGAALTNGVNQAIGRAPQMAQVLALAIEQDILRSDRLKVNLEIAEGAANAVYSKYQSRTPRRVETPYRVGENRLSGGILGDALSNIGEMVAGTTRQRIAFVNEEYLDQEAPHWARINFGAGPKHGANPKAYTVTLIGPQGGATEIARLGFGDLHRPAIRFPKGVWLGEGKNEFHPRSSTSFKDVSARATQFLDAGVKYVAQNAGNAYVGLIQRALADDTKRGELQARFNRPIRADARAGGISFVGQRTGR